MQARSLNARPRQLLVGLDAMEWTLVRKWAQEGKLPSFRRLLDQGMSGQLSTTSEQLPDTVWTAVYTGTNPAKFEKYFYVQYDPATLGLRHLSDDSIERPPFWDLLSDAGCTVGVVDAPKFKRSKKIRGFQLVNWGAHATNTARGSNPDSLWTEVKARFGKHPVGDCDKVDYKLDAMLDLKKRVLDGVRVRGKLFRALMKERQWDVFFAAFSEPHCIGHHFWYTLDPTRPASTDAHDDEVKDTIRQVYRAIDDEIGQMLELAGEDSLFMIFAAHGMGPIYHASWNIPEILELLGYGREPASEIRREVATPRKAAVNPWRILKMTLPGALQYRIKSMLPQRLQDELLFRWYAGGRDWAGCRAFAVPNNDSVGAIRVSVKGRDHNGVVAPEDYLRTCHEIADAFYELTDPATGRSVVRRVTITHEVFHGPFLDGLPDLTVLWDQTFRWESLQSPRFGTLHLRKQDGRTGSHSPYGFFVLSGTGVPAGMELTDRSTYDIAPTILELAGVPIPADLDGQPLFSATRRHELECAS